MVAQLYGDEMTSKRETIFAYLATQAAGITAVGGYNTTVKTVERWITAPELVDNIPADFPLVIIEEGSEVIDYEPSSMAMNEVTFSIRACLKGTGASVAPTTLNAFIEDIEIFIATNNTANGNAVDIIVEGVEVSHAPEISYAVAIMRCTAMYHHAVATP